MKGSYAQSTRTNAQKAAAAQSLCRSRLHLRPSDTRAYGLPLLLIAGTGSCHAAYKICVNVY